MIHAYLLLTYFILTSENAKTPASPQWLLRRLTSLSEQLVASASPAMHVQCSCSARNARAGHTQPPRSAKAVHMQCTCRVCMHAVCAHTERRHPESADAVVAQRELGQRIARAHEVGGVPRCLVAQPHLAQHSTRSVCVQCALRIQRTTTVHAACLQRAWQRACSVHEACLQCTCMLGSPRPRRAKSTSSARRRSAASRHLSR